MAREAFRVGHPVLDNATQAHTGDVATEIVETTVAARGMVVPPAWPAGQPDETCECRCLREVGNAGFLAAAPNRERTV